MHASHTIIHHEEGEEGLTARLSQENFTYKQLIVLLSLHNIVTLCHQSSQARTHFCDASVKCPHHEDGGILCVHAKIRHT